MSHQVFISYPHCDAEVALQLRAILEADGVRCWIDSAGIGVAQQWDEEIARAITSSKLLLLLITAGSLDSPREQKRELSVADKHQIPVVPLYVVPAARCLAFDYLLGNTHYFDASKPPLEESLEKAAHEIRRILFERDRQEQRTVAKTAPAAVQSPRPGRAAAPDQLASKPSRSSSGGQAVALLYRRGVVEDERLIELLQQRLGERGHVVFVDKQLPVGVEWRRVIREKVETADAVIPLISMLSVGSEMLEEEIQIAWRAQHTNGGKPRILPVRVQYEGMLAPGMTHCLQRLQYTLWRGPEDDETLVQTLLGALNAPLAQPEVATSQMEMPAGAVPLTSPFYIVRDKDRIFEAAVERMDSIILVKGARQMGKTSLIARGLKIARDQGRQNAITDLQTLDDGEFRDLRTFYTALGNLLADRLELNVSVAAQWDESRGDNVNFERFIRRDILKNIDGPLVWALDEVDRLFACDFGTQVFGLIRSWHNARANDPDTGWARLCLVIGFATEASLFIRDVNMSPFNVGTTVALTDFTLAEVEELNARYGHPIRDPGDLKRLMERVGGQPFLVRRSLYAMAVEDFSFERLIAEAASDHGVFGDQLRRFYFSLHRDAELEAAVRDFILRGRELTAEQFHRLRSAGLVVGEARQDAAVRCGIYHDYLRQHLG